jgi:hypothetical protein
MKMRDNIWKEKEEYMLHGQQEWNIYFILTEFSLLCYTVANAVRGIYSSVTAGTLYCCTQITSSPRLSLFLSF